MSVSCRRFSSLHSPPSLSIRHNLPNLSIKHSPLSLSIRHSLPNRSIRLNPPSLSIRHSPSNSLTLSPNAQRQAVAR